MRIDIYIVSRFQGKISEGNGAYAILLDTVIQDKHYRKIHLAGWKRLSFQRLAVKAVADGICYVTKPSEIVLHLDSPYAVNVIRSGEGKSHRDLWNIYFNKAKEMTSVVVSFEKEHTYRKALLERLEKDKYPVTLERR